MDEETAPKLYSFFDSFEETPDSEDEDSQNFETRAIFSLADFFKSLSTNEYYDIANRLFTQWNAKESARFDKKLRTSRPSGTQVLHRETQGRCHLGHGGRIGGGAE